MAALYREQMPKPPYNLNETNWVDQPEGALGVYYEPVSGTWIYLWVVPQTEDTQTSYVIVAKSGSKPFDAGECLLPTLKAGEC